MDMKTFRPVSKHIRMEVVMDDGNRAIFRLLYRGLYRIIVKIWPPKRTTEQLCQVTARWQQQLLLAAAARPMQQHSSLTKPHIAHPHLKRQL